MPDPITLTLFSKALMAAAARLGIALGGAMVNPIIRQHLDPFLQRFRDQTQELRTIVNRAIALTLNRYPNEIHPRIRLALLEWVGSPGWEDFFTTLVQDPINLQGLASEFANAALESGLLEEKHRPNAIALDFLGHLHGELTTDAKHGPALRSLAAALQTQQLQQGQQRLQITVEDNTALIRQEVQAIRGDLQGLGAGISEEIIRGIAALLSQSRTPSITPAEEVLDRAAQLVNANAIEKATTALSHFRQQHYDQAPITSQARYHRLLGNLEVNKECFNEAIEAFETAYRLDPQGSEAHLAKGYAEYLRKNHDAALEHLNTALDLSPGADVPLALKADTLFKLGRKDDLKALVPLADDQHPELFFILVRRLTELSDFDEAHRLLQAPRQQKPHDADLAFLEARNLFEQVAEEHDQMDQVQDLAHGLQDERLKTALDLLNSAHQVHQENQNTRGMLEVLGTRQAVLGLLGEHQKALDDATAALLMKPHSTGMKLARAFALMHLGRLKEAIASVDDIPKDQQRAQDRELLLQLLVHDHQHVRILKEIPEFYTFFQKDALKVANTQLIHAGALRETQGPQASLEFLQGLNSSHPLIQVGLAQTYQQMRQPLQAMEHYRSAFSGSEGAIHFSIGLQWAYFLLELNDLEKASDVIWDIMTPQAPRDPLELAIDLHSRSQQFDRLQQLLAYHHQRGYPKTQTVLQAEALLNFNSGAYAQAAEKLQQALQMGEDANLHLWLTQTLMHQGKKSEAIKQLHLLLALPNLHFQVRFQAAHFLKNLGEQALATQLAYGAWRDSPKNSQADTQYLRISIESMKDQQELAVVDPETAVLLTDPHGKQQWFIVTGDANPGPAEIPLVTPQARTLLGKKVGDQVVLTPGQFRAPTFTVAAILKKEDRLSLFVLERSGADPLNPFVTTNQSRDEDMSELIDVLAHLQENRVKRVSKALYELDIKARPISTLANKFEVSALDIWHDWLDTPMELKSSLMTRQELQSARQSLKEGKVVLDLSSLLLLQRLGALKQTETWWPHRYVTEQVRAVILHEIGNLEVNPSSTAHLLKPGPSGHLAGPERLVALKEVVDFITRTSVIPVPSMLEARNQQRMKNMPLGIETWSTVFAAQEQGAALYTEDAHLKIHALQGHLSGQPLTAISTMETLVLLFEQGSIDQATYETLAERLLTLNIRSVLMTKPLLVKAIRRPFHHDDPTLQAALAFMKMPSPDSQVWLGWVAEGLKEVWLDASSAPYRFDVLQVILNELERTFTSDGLMQMLQEELSKGLQGNPEVLEDLREQMELWKTRRSL